MLRVVLAAALAVALAAAAAPAVEDARARHSASHVEAELGALAGAARDLAREEPAPRGVAARRVLSVSLPGGPAAAPVEYVAVGGVPGCHAPGDTGGGDVLAYRLAGGPTRARRLPVEVRAVGPDGVRDDDEPLVLRGDARVTLTLVDRDGAAVVLVRRGP